MLVARLQYRIQIGVRNSSKPTKTHAEMCIAKMCIDAQVCLQSHFYQSQHHFNEFADKVYCMQKNRPCNKASMQQTIT